MKPAELRHATKGYLRYLGTLDDRSVALFRMVCAAAVLHDISMAWPVLEVWAGMQGFYDGLPLPHVLILDSEERTLRAIFACFALVAVGMLVGFKTRWCTLGVWIMVCGHRYAMRYTDDYHDLILTNLLLWCQSMHLGRKWSVDALRGSGRDAAVGPVETVGRAALTINLAYIYLDTALEKTGSPGGRRARPCGWR